MIAALIPNFDGTDESIAKNLSEGFHLLRVERRRQVIWRVALLNPGEEITVREIAKEIAAAEHNGSPQTVTNNEYRPVYTNLTQNHLPALKEANVITYDDERKILASGPNVEALRVLIAVAIPLFHLLLPQDMGE